MSWTKKPRQDLAGEPQLAQKAALRYLGRREYTAFELKKRLRERGADAEAISAALQYVQERGYQDDARAGESHIRQRLQYALRGRALVRQELRERGITNELAEALLQEHYPREAERDLLKRLLAREEPPRPADREEARRLWLKMVRRLAAKGFEQGAVIEELSAWVPEAPELDD